MTPNALLNLLHRGNEYLSLKDVGVLVFDECHKARKKHPYARVMAFYLELRKNRGPLPKVHHSAFSPPTLFPPSKVDGRRYFILTLFLPAYRECLRQARVIRGLLAKVMSQRARFSTADVAHRFLV